MATINHKTYNEATETFKDFNVYDGKETLIFKVDGSGGNVGIGTTSPTNHLHLNISSGAILQRIQNNNNSLYIGLESNGTAQVSSDVASLRVMATTFSTFETAGSERMRITSTGNVAIGATGPAGTEFAQLYIGADNTIMRGGGDLNISNNGYYRGGWKRVATGAASLAYQSGGEFEFYTAPSSTADSPISWSSKLKITEGGSVGIGTTSPESKLHIASSATGSDVTLYVDNAAASTLNNSARLKFSVDAGATVSAGGAELNCLNVNATNGAVDLFIKSWTGGAYTEKVRITAAGNVGIGTTSPEAKFHLNDISTGGPVGMYIRNSAASTLNNSADIYFGTWGGSEVSGITNARISAVNVSAGNAESNIDFYTYNGSASGKRVSITSNGLTFNGDTAAANALDDYEEGTFNFDITFGGSDTGVTYLNRLGAYTKIGRQVTCQGWIRLANKGTATGNAAIKGLPFTIGTGAQFYNGGCIGYIGGISFADQISSYALQGDNGYELVESTNAGVLSPITDADFTSNAEIMVSFTYFV